MELKDVKKDQYYYAEYEDKSNRIIKPRHDSNFYDCVSVSKAGFVQDGDFSCDKNIRLATLEEKHWLDECIKLNKYISKEEALKTFTNNSFVGRYLKITNTSWFGSCFNLGDYVKILKDDSEHNIQIEKYGNFSRNQFTNNNYTELMPEGFIPTEIVPEYVECINLLLSTKGIEIGKIYKSRKGDYSGTYMIEGLGDYTKTQFKPSTKEAYDAQKVEPTASLSSYKALPMPSSAVKLRVVKDIVKNNIRVAGQLPDIIPKGAITWYDKPEWYKSSGSGFIYPEDNRWSANIPKEYFELVEPLLEEELLAEAIKRYPKGTKYIALGKDSEPSANINAGNIMISTEQFSYYKSKTNVYWKIGIYSSDNSFVYCDGKWAEIVKEEKQEKDNIMFKKGDYVVITKYDGFNRRSNEVIHYCFQLLKVSSSNINLNVKDAGFTFGNFDGGYWVCPNCARQATEKEMAKYQKIGKPYNINAVDDQKLPSNLVSKSEEKIEVFVPKFKVGDKVKFISSSTINAKYFKKGLENLEVYSVPQFKTEDYSIYESDKSTIWEVQEEELEIYSPDNHPDKIKKEKPMEDCNFKIGDWVTITKSNKNWISQMDIFVGRTVQIIGIAQYSYNPISFNIKFEGCRGYFWVDKDDHFRKAYTNEIPAQHAVKADVGYSMIKRRQPPQKAPIYEVKKVKVIKRTQE